MEEIFSKIQTLLGETLEGQEDLFALLIEMATEEVYSYCGDVPLSENLIAQMVIIKYQRRGTEALSNSNYAGNGEVYLSDYPNYILRQLDDLKANNKRRLRTL